MNSRISEPQTSLTRTALETTVDLNQAGDHGVTMMPPSPSTTVASGETESASHEANILKKLVAEQPATNQACAEWILKADTNGFTELRTRVKNNLEDIQAGKKIGSIDPTAEAAFEGLSVMVSLVKGSMNEWLASGEKSPKRKVKLYSFIRSGAGLHGKAKAVDISGSGMDFEAAKGVDEIIQYLDDLPLGSYEIGLPFQGDFFPPQNEMGWIDTGDKSKGLQPPGGEAEVVDNVLIRFASHLYQAKHDKETGKWIPTPTGFGQAQSLLRSEKLKTKFAAMETAGYRLMIFPDNPNHLHIGTQNLLRN